jgi:hypothetical protein
MYTWKCDKVTPYVAILSSTVIFSCFLFIYTKSKNMRVEQILIEGCGVCISERREEVRKLVKEGEYGKGG